MDHNEIEAVARVLCEDDSSGTGWHETPGPTKETYRMLAAAVIARLDALRAWKAAAYRTEQHALVRMRNQLHVLVGPGAILLSAHFGDLILKISSVSTLMA